MVSNSLCAPNDLQLWIYGPAKLAGNGGFPGIQGYVSRFTPKIKSVVEEYPAVT